MRIIAGKFRGRPLLGPLGQTTRPITDRAKQSLFDILQPIIAGAFVYDLFAGTGSLGLECVSRGAAKTTFFEEDRSALARLRENIAALGVARRCRIVAGDLFNAIRHMEETPNIVFLDPPYPLVRERPADLRELAGRLRGLVVFRHDGADPLELPPLRSFDQRQYGQMTIEFLSRPTAGVPAGNSK